MAQTVTTAEGTGQAKRCGMRGLSDRLFEPVDIASLAIFRMMLGAILFWEVWRYFAKDWIRIYYIEQTIYFKYFGFEWVHPWAGDGMYVHFAAVGCCALCVMAGFQYRVTSWRLFFGFTYWFLLDQTRYLNHFYLTSLLLFLIALTPAHRAKSIDVWLNPDLASQNVPAWCLWVVRLQLGIVYIYAGLAKLNADWLRGEPIRQWLAERGDYPLIGPLLETEAALWFVSYGAILFDLTIAPALLWRKTRPWAFAVCVFFHVSNKVLFNIGIFPVLSLAATLLFFPPDWPRRVCLFFTPNDEPTGLNPAPVSRFQKPIVVSGLTIFAAIQLLVPLRHFLYPGIVHWTEEGHRFSWHMKLRQKRGEATFYAVDPETGNRWPLDHQLFLNSEQTRDVATRPDMTLQFAHFLGEELDRRGVGHYEIRVETMVALNAREPQTLIDANVDLSRQPRNLWPAPWILPLTQPSVSSVRKEAGR